MRHAALLLLPLLIVASTAASAEAPSCKDKSFGWSTTQPSLNLRHVFCGEYNKSGKPVGAHSMQIMATSPDVKSVGAPSVTYNGLTVRPVTFSNGAQLARKSFYPDACTIPQITESALYAAANSKPVNGWQQGPSAPKTGGAQYCLDSKGQPFTIQFAWLGQGKDRINTAFPIVPTP
ncbi:EndoU domain-containing protein [Aerophototrophica crusticola]|uniref:EndoU domain-containing protein n=1 Tax=Aerophototrophica crusticola TaxID=1709002 RepID=A0A858R4A7_9PROT|nr:EndoU domain-containing protein [Rhodospirillaceae bacterium B3]